MKVNPLFRVIKRDHRTIRSLCRKLKATTSRSIKRREELIGELAALVESHVKAEEEAFYKHVSNRHGKLHDQVMEGYEEHHVADGVLREILILKVNDEHWLPKVEVLSELLKHHLDEEEEDMFPKAQAVISDRAFEQMAEDFLERRKNRQTERSSGSFWSRIGLDQRLTAL